MDERVYVVDDDPSVLTALSRLLRAAGYAVETFSSPLAFLDSESRDGVSCLVLDVRMPALDGLALQAEPAVKDRNLPVIFLTGHGDIPMSVAAMKQGATDFLTKPVDDEVLLEAVRRALATDREQRQELKINAIAAERIATLTPRELEVLRWVIGGAMNKQIAARLGIAEKTVKIHRGRIVEKTGARAVPILVDLCRRAGIEPLPGALSR